MGTKRPIDAVHPSRRNQVPTAPRKRHKPDNLGSRSFKKAHPVNALKSKVRDLTRLLAKDDKLPANVRIVKERELQTTQYELEQSQIAERRSKMIGKYHQVRFFDRQKATKRLKQAKKMLASVDEGKEAEDARQAVELYEVDLNYAMYYPLDKPYASLYPKTAEGDGKGERGDQAIRLLVVQCMADGRLKDLREGRLTEQPRSKPQVSKTAKQKPTAQDDEDNESDGGFFE